MAGLEDHALELGGRGIELRTAGRDDQDLIRRIVALAAHWRSDAPPVELAAELDVYHHDWGRLDDVGVLVFRGIEFVGGAYARRLGVAGGGYGYVSDDLPELTIGIEPDYRRRGLGVLLLAALKAKLVEKGLAGMSLSVEPDNGARHLYTQMGFELVEDRGNDLLMAWRLRG
jgi:ribosomal protein S18 acetylase RimI-like enzyme